ncbi:hypothetical protein ACFW35_13740 [Fictibacillus sp. NPDC058756]|uniref:hypothetical protein n=1 Tax=Fictibacillus sp. NPDC058756 TaxID=3346625 RepID=UPI0036A9BDBD
MKKRSIILLVSIFITILLATGYVKYGLVWNYFYYKQEFEDYLEYKYDKPVMIKEVSYDMFHDKYDGYAFFEAKPNIVFHVGLYGKNKEIRDSYEYEAFSEQATSDVKSIADKLLPDHQHARAEVIDLAKQEIEVVIWYDKEFKEGIDEALLTKILNKGYVVKNITITNDYER